VTVFKTIAVALLACAAFQGSAHAFGPEGHAVVALIANQLLAAQTRARVDAILAREPGATLASISSWADRSRDRLTTSWHYVNMPRGPDCDYVAARDCPGDSCGVEALKTQLARLSSATGADQLEALKFVVHIVADLHQPLHAGHADDKGGNTVQLRAFGAGTNLHALWDSGLLRHIDPDASALTARLLATATPAGSLAVSPGQWAKESCLIVGRPDFYPTGRALTNDYLRTYDPIVLDRLHLAGVRLAAALDATFGPSGRDGRAVAPVPAGAKDASSIHGNSARTPTGD